MEPSFRIWVRAAVTAALVAASGWVAGWAQEVARDQLQHYSLQVDVDDEARVQMSAADSELERGDVLTAVSRWRALLDGESGTRLVPYRGAFVALREAIASTLRTQPASVLDEYRRMTEPVAARALEEALAGDDEERLWRIVERFPLTPSAAEACQHLAERCFDAGRFSSCARAVDGWLEEQVDPAKAVEQEPRMLVWRTLSLKAVGDVAEASRWWESHADRIPPELRQLAESVETTRLVPIVESTPLAIAPEAVEDLAEILPSEEVLWSRDLARAEEAGEWSTMAADFRELAHPLLMSAQPVLRDQTVLVTGGELKALALETGEPRWEHTLPSTAVGGVRVAILEGLRRALGDASTGRLTIAGDRILGVEPAPKTTRPTPFFAHQLVARSLTSGDVQWTLNEWRGAVGGERTSVVLLGPPLERHGVVIAAVQLEEQLSLIAVSAKNGRPLWSTRLGDAGLTLIVDTRRQWMPARLTAAGSHVFCATGNGAVVAVDARTGRLQWIHRSEREDWRNAGPPYATLPPNSPRFRMWTGWREPVLTVAQDLVVWAGPEADRLTGIDRTTGAVRWSRPRGEGLAVMVIPAGLVIIGAGQVQLVNPRDGSDVWTSPVRCSGLGFVAGERLIVPLRSGGTGAIDLKDGRVTRSVAWEREVAAPADLGVDGLRSLTWTPLGIVEQSPSKLTLRKTVEASRDRTGDLPSPTWLAAAGRIDEAIRALDATGDSPEEQERRTRWRNRLRLIASAGSPDGFQLIESPFNRKSPSEGADRTRDAVIEFLVDDRWATALQLLRETPLSQLETVWVQSNRDPGRQVRADVAAAATLMTEAKGTDGELRAIVSEAVSDLNSLMDHLERTRPEDARRLLALMSSSDWGAQRILSAGEPSTADVRELARRRLQLLALASRGGEPGQQARELAGRLQPERPDVADWPVGTPRVTHRPWTSLLDARPVQVEPQRDAELEGLSIDLRLTGLRRPIQFRRGPGPGVHFTGAGEDRPWEIDLDKTDRPLEQATDYRQARLVGPVVLLQVGTAVSAILPFDGTGDRGASFLWERKWFDMWGQVATPAVTYLPRLSDSAPGRHPLDVDDFARPLTQLGPVTAGFFCFRHFGTLVCCDTATGQPRWVCSPFDADATATGDDSLIVVVSPERDRVECLDPVDGRLVATRPLGAPPRRWREIIGTTAVLRSGLPVALGTAVTEPSQLAAIDLKTGETKWTQDLEVGAVDFTVGRRFAGAVEKARLRVFDLESGEVRATIPMTPPDGVTDVDAIDDPHMIMLCVTGPPAIEQLRPPLMLIGGRRQPYANGTVYGLHPETLELKWTLPLERSVFPLDQPRDIPLFVLRDQVITNPAAELEATADRLRCFDKRTGQLIIEVSGEPIGRMGLMIERSQAEGWIDVRTSKTIFRFDYAPRME